MTFHFEPKRCAKRKRTIAYDADFTVEKPSINKHKLISAPSVNIFFFLCLTWFIYILQVIHRVKEIRKVFQRKKILVKDKNQTEVNGDATSVYCYILFSKDWPREKWIQCTECKDCMHMEGCNPDILCDILRRRLINNNPFKRFLPIFFFSIPY